jgi:hypothetical protein
MLRKTLAEKRFGLTPQISWRRHNILRVEALTDVVFGFALTLLVVAAEVPTTFNALVGTLVHFPAFVLSFSILLALWHAHHQFFRALSPTETAAVRTEIAQGMSRIAEAALSILIAWITRDAAIGGLVSLAYPFIRQLGNRWQRAQLARLTALEPLVSSSQVS